MRRCFRMFRARIEAIVAGVAAIRAPHRVLKEGEFKNSPALGAAGIFAATTSASAIGKVQEWNLHIENVCDRAGKIILSACLASIRAFEPQNGSKVAIAGS
jgi:hypothetical protein